MTIQKTIEEVKGFIDNQEVNEELNSLETI